MYKSIKAKLTYKQLWFLFIFCPLSLLAQTLTLQQANDLARQNYPLVKQRDLIKQTGNITIENLSKGYLPQLTLSGQASYQSAVTEINSPIPGFKVEPLSKDQYKIVADVNQVIYDGGVIKEQQHLQQLNSMVEEQQLEIELYRLKERINQIYLSVLLLDEQIKQVAITKQDIETGIKRVEAQVQNGTAFKSNLNVLKAEMLKNDERLIELQASRKGLIETLGLFLNQSLAENIFLITPAVVSLKTKEITRPEINLYEKQSLLAEQQTNLIDARNHPKFSAFVQGGYGRPGLNFLKNEFDPYYIAGVRFNWSFGSLYTSKGEKQIADINRSSIDLQKETFILNTNTEIEQQQSEIEKWKQLITSDSTIIELRKSIKEAANAQLENGVITASDYLREVNAEDQARQTLITHQLQLLQAQINYQTILGK